MAETGKERGHRMMREAGYKVGGKVDPHSDKAADVKLIKKAFKEHENAEHGGKHEKLRLRRGGKVKGGKKPEARPDRRARGGMVSMDQPDDAYGNDSKGSKYAAGGGVKFKGRGKKVEINIHTGDGGAGAGAPPLAARAAAAKMAGGAPAGGGAMPPPAPPMGAPPMPPKPMGPPPGAMPPGAGAAGPPKPPMGPMGAGGPPGMMNRGGGVESRAEESDRETERRDDDDENVEHEMRARGGRTC